jgi:hypothetical protein
MFGPMNSLRLSRIPSQLLLGSWWHLLQPSNAVKCVKIIALHSRYEFWVQGKVIRWQIWGMRGLQKHRNALLSVEIHELTMLCARAHCRDETPRITSSEISIRTRNHPLPQKSQEFQIIFLIHCDTRWYKLFLNYSAKIYKKIWSLSSLLYMLMRSSFCLRDWGVRHSWLCLLVSGSYSKRLLSSLDRT